MWVCQSIDLTRVILLVSICANKEYIWWIQVLNCSVQRSTFSLGNENEDIHQVLRNRMQNLEWVSCLSGRWGPLPILSEDSRIMKSQVECLGRLFQSFGVSIGTVDNNHDLEISGEESPHRRRKFSVFSDNLKTIESQKTSQEFKEGSCHQSPVHLRVLIN